MKILGLDTSTMMATCAVVEDNNLLGEFSLNQDMSHSENLVPMIKEVLENLKIGIEEIDLFTVALGPGSFTGLRIGVATVKAFAHLFNKPIVGVSTIEALAYNLPYNEIVVPMIDARRERVYTGIYTWKEGKLETIMEADVIEVVELLERLKSYDNIVVNGNGTITYKEIIQEKLGSKVKFSTVGQNSCRGASICELGLLRYKEGKLDDFYTLAPEYLRETQAQRELKSKS